MSAKHTNKSSATDWARVDALTDATIDPSDIPGLSQSFFRRAKLRMPHQSVSVTVHIDSDVLAWFQATGAEYEKRINAALRIYAEAHQA
jgi:uncharacterized protein (DUF4415 family)